MADLNPLIRVRRHVVEQGVVVRKVVLPAEGEPVEVGADVDLAAVVAGDAGQRQAERLGREDDAAILPSSHLPQGLRAERADLRLPAIEHRLVAGTHGYGLGIRVGGHGNAALQNRDLLAFGRIGADVEYGAGHAHQSVLGLDVEWPGRVTFHRKERLAGPHEVIVIHGRTP